MLSTSLFAILYLAIQVSSTPVLQSNQPIGSLSFTKRFNLTNGHHLVQHGQARAKVFSLRVSDSDHTQARAVVNVPVEDQEVSYLGEVEVGSRGDKYQLIIDTGSSNMWVPDKKYVRTSTSMDTGDKVSVNYGSGKFSGEEFIDRVSLGKGLVIQKQSFGVATMAQGFNTQAVDGVLGLGWPNLTRGTLSPDSDDEIPTVTDNLFSDKKITSNELSISFEPTNRPKALNGVLTWGGIDRTKFTGSITWLPLTETLPASSYWGIDGAMRYGDFISIFTKTAGIVDTGSPLLLIATDAFQRYQRATGAVEDRNTGLLRLTMAQFRNLESIFFLAEGSSFELTANAQIWPRSLNIDIGGTASNIYLIISDLGTPTGRGLDFILGQTFLERFYSVYDTGNRRVGLARTRFTTADIN